jgi:ferredoxin-NADP reductase
MSEHTVHLRQHGAIAAGTSAFHFDRPTGFDFRAGQAVDLILPGSPGAEEQRHAFSLVSAPHEGELVIATRMRDSAYKRTLASLAAGTPVRIDGPFGSLTLHRDRRRPAVMIAGGIGITPFVSLLRQAAKEESEQPMRLIYSNRRPEDAAFLAGLQRLERCMGNFRLLATMTGMARSAQPWTGETRKIDEALLTSACAGLVAPVYYLAGPLSMVRAVRETLSGAGVEDDDVRNEEFYGY